MIRDQRSKALISTDRASLDKYRTEKQRARQLDALQRDVTQLKDQVTALTAALNRIMEEK